MSACMFQHPVTGKDTADLAREWLKRGLDGNATARRNPKARRYSDLLEEARYMVCIRCTSDRAASVVGFTNDEAAATGAVRRFNETIRRPY